MDDSQQGGSAAGGAALASTGNGGARPEDADAVEIVVQDALDGRDVSDAALMPLMTGASIDELKTYQSLFILETLGEPPSKASPLKAAIDPFAAQPGGQDVPAVGVLTTHHQSWTQQGLALGNLLHSVCLAPGEVTQVAVVDWQRQTSGESRQTAEQGERVASSADQTRAVNEVQNAVAREAQSGASSSISAAVTAQAGVSAGGLLGSVSASSSTSATSAFTAQFSSGTRDLAASSTNALSQRTAEASQALRTRRAAVVKEVSEHEAENLSSRVLANYNRRHALNIEYFEVLQLYAIETRLADWERCLFVPMQPIDFSKPEVIEQHKAALTRIFIESGRAELVQQLLFDKDSEAAKRIDDRIAQLDARMREIPASADPPAQAFYAVAQASTQAERQALVAERAALMLTTTERLMAEQLTLSQAIWMRMDPFRLYRMLAPFTLDDQPLAGLIEPYPVGVFGNCLAFRWRFDGTDAGAKQRQEFESKYIAGDRTAPAVTSNIAVPTSGVFAEAVLGRGQAAETIDDTRLWDWSAFPIPILPEGLAALTRNRARDFALDSGDFAPALAQLRASAPDDASHLNGILGALSSGSMFRDMGGLAQAVTLADKVAAITGAGAKDAGARAAQIHGKILDTFVDVLNSDVGKAAVAEFMLPGAGAAVLQGSGGGKPAAKKPAAKMSEEEDEAG